MATTNGDQRASSIQRRVERLFRSLVWGSARQESSVSNDSDDSEDVDVDSMYGPYGIRDSYLLNERRLHREHDGAGENGTQSRSARVPRRVTKP